MDFESFSLAAPFPLLRLGRREAGERGKIFPFDKKASRKFGGLPEREGRVREEKSTSKYYGKEEGKKFGKERDGEKAFEMRPHLPHRYFPFFRQHSSQDQQ